MLQHYDSHQQGLMGERRPPLTRQHLARILMVRFEGRISANIRQTCAALYEIKETELTAILLLGSQEN